MKNNLLIVLILILLVGNLGLTLFLLARGPVKALHPKGIIEPIEQELKMTPEQVRQHRKLVNDHANQNKLLEQKMDDLRADLYSQWAWNRSSVDSIATDLGSVFSQREVLLYDHLNSIAEILDENQQSRFLELTRKAAGKPPHRPGNPPPPPGHGPPPLKKFVK